MKDRACTLFGDTTQEELNSCIQLLALSLVQHRAKCAFVPFRESIEHMRPGDESEEIAGLFVESSSVMEEALEAVRILAAEPPPEPEPETPAEPLEKRRQLRINVTAPIKVLWPSQDIPTRANLKDISWGGAAFVVDEVRMDSGDTLQLLLPGTKGSPINIEAKVLRTWKLDDGQGEGVAVRFSSLATTDEDELEEVLKLLAQSADSDGLRQHARLTQRLDIQFHGADDLHATLDDISAGGLGVTVPDPLQIGQSIQAVISTLDEECSLKLRARVVRLEPVKMGNVELYHAGLKFEHHSEELAELTSKLIDEMVSGRR
jgi:c-di-GMP-binding flagellar brake protein YcgR